MGKKKTSTSSRHKIVSFITLFTDSWQTLLKSLSSLFIFTLVGLAVLALWSILGIILLVTIGLTSPISQLTLPSLISLPFPLIILSVILATIFIIGFIVISSAMQIGTILIIDAEGKKMVLLDLIKKSLKLLLPFISVSILTGVIIAGSFFALILPAILFAYLLIFASYEVILNHEQTVNALKKSILITSKNFWGILLRVAAVTVLSALIGIMIPDLLSKLGPENNILSNSLSLILNILIGWFSLTFMIILYKHARPGLEEQKGLLALKWVLTVAVAGWVIAAMIAYGIIAR